MELDVSITVGVHDELLRSADFHTVAGYDIAYVHAQINIDEAGSKVLLVSALHCCGLYMNLSSAFGAAKRCDS